MNSDSWVLFGLDLRPYAASLRVAGEQLLWGQEAGVHKHLSASVRLRNAESSEPVLIDVFGDLMPASSAEAVSDQKDGLVLGSDQVLTREITLPEAFEAQWREATDLEVQNASPFSVERTRYGSKIIARQDGQITIAVVITSTDALDELISDNPEVSQDAEIWCDTGQYLVRINDSGKLSARQVAYLARLKVLAVRCLALIVAASVCLWLPALAANIRAGQYAVQLDEARETSSVASAFRADLDDQSDKLSAASERFSRPVQHAAWLHALSALTPDGAYLSRIEFDADTVEISGYAVNAADLQSRLVASELFSDVTATTAFRLNARMKLEQFSFELSLGELSSVQGVVAK